jgi:CheY-like chemotaxis protein
MTWSAVRLALAGSAAPEVGKVSLMSRQAWMDYVPGIEGVGVLVVDDSADVLAAMTKILEDCGATVTAVGSADEALEAVERERPDVLVSDLPMPEKDGYWLIGQVRALPPERGGHVPAAALTAAGGPEHRANVLRAGFEYHIEKPIDPGSWSASCRS